MTVITDNIKNINSAEALSPGGENPDRFDWLEVWYPLYYIQDLNKQKLNTFTLLEKNLVIWWEKDTETWRVFIDKCPHRLAPLSEGRINEQGYLECPYHGWTFSGTGECQAIPQQNPEEKAQTSRRACVTSLPTQVAQGLLFVYPGTPELADKTKLPLVDALETDSSEWVCLNTFRDIPYDALTLMENVLDSSHIPYTHHKTVGNRSNVAPVNLEVVNFGKQGFTGVWEEGPRRGTLGKQDTTFIAPNLMWHDLTSKQFGRTLTVVYATPISKGKCRLFARFPFKFASKFPQLFLKLTPTWYSHLGQNRVLEDDQIFLHYQERYLESDGGNQEFAKAFYLPTKADSFVIALHNWINKYQAQPFPESKLSLPLSQELLLDRYHSHTKYCASCSQALLNLQRIRLGMLIASGLIWALTPVLLIYMDKLQLVPILVSNLTVVTTLLVWWLLGRLERGFKQGKPIPPRNLS